MSEQAGQNSVSMEELLDEYLWSERDHEKHERIKAEMVKLAVDQFLSTPRRTIRLFI